MKTLSLLLLLMSTLAFAEEIPVFQSSPVLLETVLQQDIEAFKEEGKREFKRLGFPQSMKKERSYWVKVAYALTTSYLREVPVPEELRDASPNGVNERIAKYLTPSERSTLVALHDSFEQRWETFLSDDTGSTTVPGWWFDESVTATYLHPQPGPVDETVVAGEGQLKTDFWNWINDSNVREKIRQEILEKKSWRKNGARSKKSIIKEAILPVDLIRFFDLNEAITEVWIETERLSAIAAEQSEFAVGPKVDEPQADDRAWIFIDSLEDVHPLVPLLLPVEVLSQRLMELEKMGLDRRDALVEEALSQIDPILATLETALDNKEYHTWGPSICTSAGFLCRLAMRWNRVDNKKEQERWRKIRFQWGLRGFGPWNGTYYYSKHDLWPDKSRNRDWTEDIAHLKRAVKVQELTLEQVYPYRTFNESTGISAVSVQERIYGYIPGQHLPAMSTSEKEWSPVLLAEYLSSADGERGLVSLSKSFLEKMDEKALQRRFDDYQADIYGHGRLDGSLIIYSNNLAMAAVRDPSRIPKILEEFADYPVVINGIRLRMKEKRHQWSLDELPRTKVDRGGEE